MNWFLVNLEQVAMNCFIVLGIVMIYHLIMMKTLSYYETKRSQIDYTFGVLNTVSIGYFSVLSFVFQIAAIDPKENTTILNFTVLMVTYVTLYLGFKGGLFVVLVGFIGRIVSTGCSATDLIFWLFLVATVISLRMIFYITNRPGYRLVKNLLAIELVSLIFYLGLSNDTAGISLFNHAIHSWEAFSVLSLILGVVLHLLASENDYVAKAAYGASTDGVTKLKNFSEYNLRLEAFFNLNRLKRIPVVLVEIDIDHFKKVNDKHGHPMGNTLLRKFAELLTEESHLVPGTETFRVGGEEFALIMSSIGPEVSRGLITRLQRRWEQVQRTELDLDEPTTLSVGITTIQVTDESYQDVYDRVDHALYRAKKNGRNQIVVMLSD